MEHSEKSLPTPPSKSDSEKSQTKKSGTRSKSEKSKSSLNTGSGGVGGEGDVKASLMDSLAQLDPQALLLIQVRINKIT